MMRPSNEREAIGYKFHIAHFQEIADEFAWALQNEKAEVTESDVDEWKSIALAIRLELDSTLTNEQKGIIYTEMYELNLRLKKKFSLQGIPSTIRK